MWLESKYLAWINTKILIMMTICSYSLTSLHISYIFKNAIQTLTWTLTFNQKQTLRCARNQIKKWSKYLTILRVDSKTNNLKYPKNCEQLSKKGNNALQLATAKSCPRLWARVSSRVSLESLESQVSSLW